MKMNLCKLKQGQVFKYHKAHWMKLIRNKQVLGYACVKLETGDVFLFNGKEKIEPIKFTIIHNK